MKKIIGKGYFGKVRSVFFIDDHLKNLQDVKRALNKNIIFTGIHLTEGIGKDRVLSDFTEDELNDLVKDHLRDLMPNE